MPQVTVVIPAYNAEKYIEETLASLRGQTLPDWEALIVDDGSTDATAHLAEQASARDARFHLLRQENAGVSAARNHGLREARGTYILFLDSDDTLTADSLRSFCETLDRTGADAAIGRLQSFGAVEEKYNGYADALSKRETIDKFDKDLLWNFLVGNKCYRLESLRRSGVTFPQIGYSEEGAFFMEFVLSDAVTRLAGTTGATMRYRRHDAATDASVSQRVNEKLIGDFLTAMARIRTAAEHALADDSGRDGYIQEILYKGDYVLLSQFYRLLWQADDAMLRRIEQGHADFQRDMTDGTKARVLRLNADLPQLFFDRGEAAAHPRVSIALAGADTSTLDALYMQSMPLFEIFVPQGTNVPPRWKSCENLHVLPKKGFMRAFRKARRGKYTLVLRRPCKADSRTLRFLLRAPTPHFVKACAFTLLFRAVQFAVNRRP
ncbi:MAG: glycosyltransferase family 2 protein [Clostridia bacterium]|nr:glycosyltransferase family 2 protein [Clostridia bacterium]